MHEELQNSGIFILNGQRPGEHATVAVAGVPRSGTTMVAQALAELGVYMGDEIDQSVHEDLRIARAIEDDPDTLPGVIDAYNREHGLWGFKRPTAFKTINPSYFRNLHFVLTFRDPIAIAKREERSMGSDFREQLKRSAELSKELVEFALDRSEPTMLVSYEKALQIPVQFVEELARFLCLSVSAEVLRAAARTIKSSPSEYVMRSQVRFPQESS